MPNTKDFQDQLRSILLDAGRKGKMHIDINSGELHRKLGGYPGPNHQMPICCSVMKREMKDGDLILDGPLSGKGASLTIRYLLPR